VKHRVASTEDVIEGIGLCVAVEDKRLAIFLYQGSYYAIDDACPHRGSSLHEGKVDQGVVLCPWHQWRFDLRTGLSPVNPQSRIETYRIWSEGEDIMVEVPGVKS
jgi:nitrite reductase (NADH) small subunit/3-phenylpropionate/trans-cinnamate dioxygenase ferredoxin subunit